MTALVRGSALWDFFQLNSLPMWVFDLESLKFLEVNPAAIINYGYSREEFMQMTIKDIRPLNAVDLLDEELNKRLDSFEDQNNWEHIIADGSLIWVKITSFSVTYNERKAKLVNAINVSQLIEEKELLAEAHRKISWQHSHILRAPVANILALSQLFKNGENTGEVAHLLEQETTRLDKIVMNIINAVNP